MLTTTNTGARVELAVDARMERDVKPVFRPCVMRDSLGVVHGASARMSEALMAQVNQALREAGSDCRWVLVGGENARTA